MQPLAGTGVAFAVADSDGGLEADAFADVEGPTPEDPLC